MWIEDGNCMPGEAKWAIFPPITPPPRSFCRIYAYSFMKALLRHSIRWCGDTFLKSTPWKTKKRQKAAAGKAGGQGGGGCIIMLPNAFAGCVCRRDTARLCQNTIAIPIHILTCIPAYWCWYIQGPQNCLLTSQFRTPWSQQRLFKYSLENKKLHYCIRTAFYLGGSIIHIHECIPQCVEHILALPLQEIFL